MDVINIDNFCEHKQYINNNFFAPQWPSRILVIGPSGSGKSNVVCNLILKDIHFDELYVYAKDLSEDKYIYLIEFFNEIENKIKKKIDKIKKPKIRHDKKEPKNEFKIAHFSDSLDDIININDLNPEKQTLIVFDDFIQEKDQSKIKEIFLRGRKRNVSVIYISQSFFKTPKMVRLNSNYIVLFNLNNKRELIEIAKTYSCRFDSKIFIKLYNDIMKNKYSFMVIDTVTNDLEFHIRSGWDKLLDIKLLQE